MTWARYQWDRVAAGVLVVIGLLALLLGYLGISGTVYPAEQLPYIISGGILGIFCLGSAGVLYLSADMRDEWRKLDELDQTIKNAGLLFAAALDEAPAAPGAPTQLPPPLRSVPPVDPPTAPIQVVPVEVPVVTPAAARAPRAARTRQPATNPRPARTKKPLQSEALQSS